MQEISDINYEPEMDTIVCLLLLETYEMVGARGGGGASTVTVLS